MPFVTSCAAGAKHTIAQWGMLLLLLRLTWYGIRVFSRISVDQSILNMSSSNTMSPYVHETIETQKVIKMAR